MEFSIREILPAVSVPADFEQKEDRYPVTISFADACHAVVANGFGKLTIYNTGNRAESEVWKVCSQQ